MATVDRKNNDDTEHSLSSFDKRKVQSVTFGAKKLDRKKYKVVKHEAIPPRAAPKENVCCQVDNESRAPVEHEEKVGTNITFKNNLVKHDNHGSIHHRNPENNADTGTSDISPEMAQRMKRAAFLAQQNKEAIQLNRAAVVNDETEAFHDSSENSSKNTAADIPKRTEITERKPFDSRFLSLKSDNSDDMTASEKLKFKANIAKAEFIEKFKDSINTNRRNDLGVRYLEEHRKEGYKYDTVSEAVNDGAAFNVTPNQIRELDGGGHTLMDKALKINDYSVYNPDNPEYRKGRNSADGDYIGKAVQMGKTVQNSSSVGSAVTDVATTIAAVEAKKLVAKIMKGEMPQRTGHLLKNTRHMAEQNMLMPKRNGTRSNISCPKRILCPSKCPERSAEIFCITGVLPKSRSRFMPSVCRPNAKTSRRKCSLISTRTISTLFPIR